MSQYSGYKRSLFITVTKYSDGVKIYEQSYPTSTDIANGYFTYDGINYNIPNENELSYMSATTYNDLVTAFKLYVNYAENISITETQINNNVEYDPITCSGETQTTTTIEPTTTLVPITPINYSVRFRCTPNLSEVIVENYFGGSGVYEVGTILYSTESQALNAPQFNAGINPYSYIAVSDGTYWVAVRDANNPTNIIAKMIDVICSSTTTIEPTTTTVEPTTTTLEPTTTIEPNANPIAYDHTENILRGVALCTQSILPYPDYEWFPYSDSDGDTLNAIKFITVPQYGLLTKDNFTSISPNEIIPYPFTTSQYPYYYYIMYTASASNTGEYVDTVQFQVRTNNNSNWSNTATLTFNVNWCIRPTTTAGPQDCTIFVPEGFSPNNDGTHDYFEVYGLRCYPVHRMSIFTRNGNLVYRRTNDYYDNPWDGKINGVIYQESYTWVLEINGSVHSSGGVYVAL